MSVKLKSYLLYLGSDGYLTAITLAALYIHYCSKSRLNKSQQFHKSKFLFTFVSWNVQKHFVFWKKMDGIQNLKKDLTLN